jgi:hypothetical protein
MNLTPITPVAPFLAEGLQSVERIDAEKRRFRSSMNMRAVVLVTICLISVPALIVAQTDEIQVYDGEIAPP